MSILNVDASEISWEVFGTEVIGSNAVTVASALSQTINAMSRQFTLSTSSAAGLFGAIPEYVPSPGVKIHFLG